MKPKHPNSRKFTESGLFEDLKSFSVLERRILSLPEVERGDAFEVFAEAYLATQKISQAKNIWPSLKLPPRLVKKFNLGRRKHVGLDGVYETVTGDWHAYEVKFRTSPNLTWGDISSFFGRTERFDQRIVLTNCNRLAAEIEDSLNTSCIRGNDLDRLTKEDFLAISAWLNDREFEPQRATPDRHQEEALEQILPALEDNDRLSAIMACGTGKTLLTLWVAEKRKAKTVLVLVPSLALVRQTLHEWLKHTHWQNMAYVCVCSDPSVQRGEDNIVVRPSELDFPVDTEPHNVQEFLKKDFSGVKIVFSTYQSAHVVGKGMLRGFRFDLGIFDEAHKTAGRQGKKNSFALDDANIRIHKRLFVTATPRHYSPRQRTIEGEQVQVYSMDNPDLYGPLESRYELSFAEAARRKIICDYKIIVSVITTEEVTNELLKRGEVLVEGDAVRARQVANQLAIKAAIDEYGIKKVFSFHPRIKSAESFTSNLPEGINSVIPNLPAYSVKGSMNAANREAVMKEFAEQETGIVSNAKCLTEGVDVPAVDMVAFMSPKKSMIDIVQATGRAMRRPRGRTRKRYGYVFLPLYIEQTTKETEEEAINRTGFDELVDVLNAMKEQDDVLADIIRQMREDRGRVGGYDDSQFRDRVEVIGQTLSLDILREALTAFCVDHLGASWDERFGELVAFKVEFDHCNVPRYFEANPVLGSWCHNQRSRKKGDNLSAERIMRLESIGFVFDPNEVAWEEMFAKLVAFKDKYGNCDVPARFEADPKLGMWCPTQRTAKKENRLSPERVERLEAIGFVFDPNEVAWEEMFAKLVAYKGEFRDCNVPRYFEPNPELGAWCSNQRTAKKENRLSPERIERLKTIGFVFDPNEAAWQEIFMKLVAYRDDFGDCNVPQRFEAGPELGAWCNTQRKAYKHNRLSPERIERLETIGFVFDPREAAWEEMFAKLVAFKDKYGNCDVPLRYEADPGLGWWCSRQRKAKKKDNLSRERMGRLQAIGFQW